MITKSVRMHQRQNGTWEAFIVDFGCGTGPTQDAARGDLEKLIEAYRSGEVERFVAESNKMITEEMFADLRRKREAAQAWSEVGA